MFSGRPSVPLSVRPSVRACVRPSVRDSRGSFMFPRYLQYLLTDFRQTFVTGASWDTDDLVTFLGQKVKVQGHTIAAEAHSTRRYRQVKLFSSCFCDNMFTVLCNGIASFQLLMTASQFNILSFLDDLPICRLTEAHKAAIRVIRKIRYFVARRNFQVST